MIINLLGFIQTKEDFMIKIKEDEGFKPIGIKVKEYNSLDNEENFEV